jgi:hypothetical protein
MPRRRKVENLLRHVSRERVVLLERVAETAHQSANR